MQEKYPFSCKYSRQAQRDDRLSSLPKIMSRPVMNMPWISAPAKQQLGISCVSGSSSYRLVVCCNQLSRWNLFRILYSLTYPPSIMPTAWVSDIGIYSHAHTPSIANLHAQHVPTQLLGYALSLTTTQNVIMAANSQVDSDSEQSTSESNLSGHRSSEQSLIIPFYQRSQGRSL